MNKINLIHKTLIITIIFSFSHLYANNNWEKIYEFGKQYDLKAIESFSKDTFILSTYFNSKRNDNITWEYALWITTDVGESWKMIYQDSTGVEDIPKMAQQIVRLHVSDNSVISFIREDGYFVYSKDYGETWDSVKALHSEMKFTLSNYSNLDSYGNKYIFTYKGIDTLYYYDLDTKELKSSYLPPPYYNDDPNLMIVLLNGYELLGDDYIMCSARKFFADSVLGFTYISEDRGKTWDLYDRKNVAFKHSFIDNKLGYSCGVNYTKVDTGIVFSPSIDKTTDGGKTWSNLYVGEPDYEFVTFAKNRNSYIAITRYNINPWSSDILFDWERDSISVPVTDGGTISGVSCDDFGNCLVIQRVDHVHRILNPESSIEDYISTNENISYIDYYDFNGNNLGKIKSENDLNTGLFIKAFKDKYNNIIKSEKLIITK
ncbi:MAG: hypothetical protein R2863_06960 [Candidatus Kapaibacterium sp.]|nr:hypothetical protein [Ignavibacteriota bacterium]MCB9221605.1 hypothetical protein [Ignavibacteria bacterium]